MNHAFESIQQMSKMLRNLDQWIDKTVAWAKEKPFDADVLVGARLSPDMYSFDRQVQSACDSAKFTAAYLTGKDAPAHPDVEKTMSELRQRIATVLGWLETVKEGEFAGAEERRVSPRWLQGKWMRGDQYLAQCGGPNFFFHVTMAYAILRHNGAPLGKMDFLGTIPIRD